ncbi:hypothetical protein GmRootA79_06330 [Acidovorax sp. A79]|jgi:hypothetical protein|uniref:hypothetical protein n=1 Tax=unclassified Acidovorax TaxID=2684926 RepID=UPI001C45BB25|nr:hypothetical protein [Acidovorax sp. sic0104]MBV7540904.1 hypothetical protein [Acidovorax sp. sic0104]
MPTASANPVHDAARRVLRTTANAWRLKAPARRPVRTRNRVHAGVRADVAAGGMRACPLRFGFSLAGYGLAFSY